MRNTRGITLIALIITIIVLLILAAIGIVMLIGENGILTKAEYAGEETKEKSATEKVQLMLTDYITEKYTGTKILEEYLNEQKVNGELDEITNNGNGTITVEVDGYEITIKEDDPSIIETVKADEEKPTIEESSMFSKAYGVIDIVWLNTDNTTRETPLSPKEHLAGLTPIKYSENKWIEADENNSENDWYNYVAQTGNTDGKTSYWANAKTSDSNAYFVWIPRYAYKITYFDTNENANKYRENNSSTEGIIGYSNIEGMIDVTTGTSKLVKGSEPINVDRNKPVKTSNYSEYIPHPAFAFDGEKAGIWVGKFESNGNINKVTIIPNTESLKNVTVSNIFEASTKVKTIYGLNCDSHMMKNIEWGAVAYLTESKYGRNGVEVSVNNNNYKGGEGNYITNVFQSTTGNMYGIYDMNGASWEYVAGIMSSKLSNSNYYDFTNIDKKYYDSYDNYHIGMKGDAIWETSTATSKRSSWHEDSSQFLELSNPVFLRGRLLWLWYRCCRHICF